MSPEKEEKPVKMRVMKEETNANEEEEASLSVSVPKKSSTKEPKQELIDGDDEDEDSTPLSLSKSKKSLKKEPKNEMEGDDEDHLPLSLSKKKKAPRKKVKEEGEDGEDKKHMAPKRKIKKEVEKMKIVKKVSKRSVVANGTGREKKVYDLPGQKHDPPEKRDPLRIFYESLYQQVPTSDMAAVWMMEWGLLPYDEAEAVYEKKRKNLQQKLRSPIKTVTVQKNVKVSVKQVNKETPVKTNSKVTKKRKASDGSSDEGDDYDDFVLPKKKLKK